MQAKKLKNKVVLLRSNPVLPDPPVEKMADTLMNFGYDVVILAWDRTKDYSYNKTLLCVKGRNIPIVRFGCKADFGAGKKSAIALLKFEWKLFLWLSTHRDEYDIIHAFDFDTGFVSKLCTQLYSKKFVYHILDFYAHSHALKSAKLINIVKKMEFSVINSSDSTIICTEKRKEQILGSSPKKLIVIHNTPQIDIIPDDTFFIKKGNGICKIAYVGVLVNGRFITEILDFVAHNKSFELHIGGFGPLETKIKQYSHKFDNIFYYGKLIYPQTLALEAQCDIMTAIYDPSIPNHKYAAPNKFYESLMLKKPIIMVKNTGFDDIIKLNGNGYLMDYTVDGLTEAFMFMLQKKKSWQEMGNKAYQMYTEEYSWNVMSNRIIELYSSL